jgi:L-malate glycosyltransferase
VLSRLDRVKGIEYFLEAAAMVARRVPEARFLVVGDATKQVDGDYRKELERRADRLGVGARIRFTGLRSDVPDILAEVAVSVLPSLSEGLSNVLLESMAAGVPVVATTVGGNPEAVEDGVTGLLVPPRDPGALAQAICRFLDSPELASRFGQAGRERVLDRFSLERMVQETESLYLDLLSRAGHRIDPHTREAWGHKFVQHKAVQ